MNSKTLSSANRRLLFLLVFAALSMTAFWIYFIIAKEPLTP